MVHQIFGYSFVLTCLYFSPYLLFAGDRFALWLAMGLAAAGAIIQFFLLRKGKKACWFPLLCLAAEAVFEVVWQLSRLPGTMFFKSGDDMWSCILFGGALLYVLLGAFLGWAVQRRFQARKKEGKAS